MRELFSTIVIIVFLATIAYIGMQSIVGGGAEKVEIEIGKTENLTGKVLDLRILDKNDLGEVLKLNAKEALVNDSVTKMKYISAVFSSKKHKTIEISSDTGEYMSKTKDAVFSGSVEVKSKQPFSLKTQRLDFVSDKRILKTDLYVEYITDGTKISGKGMIIEIDTQNVEILSSVDATFN